MHASHHARSLVWPSSPAQGIYANRLKRLFDLILIVFSAPITLLIISALAVANWCKGGSAFFTQERIGKNEQVFQCWKLRTMVMNSEEVLAAHLANCPVARAEWRKNQKLTNDPRITKFGRFLRTSSMDELPQIFNIMKGEMSIVGPRPVLADELERYGNNALDYLSLRPGLTGLWQTSGRNNISYDGRISLDVKYRKTISLFLDIRIIFATVGVVIARNGM